MKLIPRSEWGAREPRDRRTRVLSARSTGHWNGNKIVINGVTTWDHSKCASIVRGIQNFHMDGRGWVDIAYNFIVCPHEFVFEGRGINVTSAANGVTEANLTSHAIMVLAGEGNPFPDGEKIGFRRCVKYISERTPAPDECCGHRDHKATACPGEERYQWIRRGMPLNDTPEPLPVLRVGSRGDHVRWVQAVIRNKAGGDISVDGIFGPHTEKRVKDLQRFFGLVPDGVVGPKTWGIIDFLANS